MKKINKQLHTNNFFLEVAKTVRKLDLKKIDKICKNLVNLRKNKGRVFFIGVGGSAANCSHAVNDFRKLCNIESYSAFDNISEMTARINDDGWNSSLVGWLKVSRLSKKDAIFVLSVGGGNLEKNVSVNIVESIQYAKKCKSKIFGIVGDDGGFTKKNSNLVVTIPNNYKKLITPITESFQSLVWHCLVSHPLLQVVETKW